MNDDPGKFKLPTAERKEALELRKQQIAKARLRPRTVRIDGKRYTLIRLPDGYGDTT